MGAATAFTMGCCLCITSGPNRALIKSGACVSGHDGGPQVIGDGGCICVLPFCQTYGTLDLTIKTVSLDSKRVLSKKGVNVSLHGVAQVRINKREEMLNVAAAQFLGLESHQVTNVVTQTMEGHQRAIIGAMTMEQLYSDRKEFASQVREVCKEDMLKMGMEVVSYVITDITDENKYFDSLGVARIQEVIKNAKVGEEKYTSEVKINQAMCNAQVEIEKVQREQEANKRVQECKKIIAEHQTRFKVADVNFNKEISLAGQEADFEVNKQKADFVGQINQLNAVASAAKDIAETAQQVLVEEQNKLVVSMRKEVEYADRVGQTKVDEQEVLRKKNELNAAIEVPANAKASASKIVAEADKTVKTTLAEGEAAKIKLEAEARAKATMDVGNAEAEIIEKRGVCEAKAMTEKAAAWKEYTEGAYIDMILQQLPEIAEKISAPLAKTEKIVMISNGADAGTGAAKLTKEVTQMVAELPAVAQGLTGVDIKESIMNMARRGGGRGNL